MADGQNITNSIGIETSKAVDNVKTLQAQLRELTDTMSKTVALGKEVPAAMTEQANVLTSQIEALKSSYGKGAEAQEQYQQRAANAVLKANEKASAAEEKRLQSALQSMDKESQKLADAEAKKYRSRKEWNDKAAENTSKRAQSEEEALQSALRRMDVARDKEIAADTARYQRRADIERARQEKGAQIIAKQQAQEAALTAKGDEAALQSALRRMNERSAAEDAMMQQRQAKWTEWNRQNAENTAERAAMSNIVAPGHSAEELSAFAKLPSYAEQMRTLNTEAEKLYRVWKQTGDVNDRIAFDKKASSLSALNHQADIFNRQLGVAVNKSGIIDQFLIKAKSHLAWIATGAMIGAVIGTVGGEIDSLVKLDEAMAGVKQVMPEIDGAGKSIEEMAVAQSKANQEAQAFITIAAKYGSAATEVMDAARSIGRMYGKGENGIENTNIMTSQAAKMSVADNFGMIEATKGLESAMAQWNLQTENSQQLLINTNRILDVWTKTAHNGAASAQDIGAAIEQAGTAAQQAGVSFEFFNALVATGVRATAKSGNEIGTAIKSMMVSMQTDKAQKALAEWGISLTKIGKDGKQTMRSMEDIILDVSTAINTTNKDSTQLLMTLSGGKYQYSKVSAMLKDYKELMHMLGVINKDDTVGFTEKQVQTQMETISRQMKTIKADVDAVVMDIGANGGISTLSSMAKHIDNIVVGLNKMNGGFGEAIKTVIEFTVAFKGIDFAIRTIMTMKAAFTMMGASIASETARTSALSGALSVLRQRYVTNTQAAASQRMAKQGLISAEEAYIAQMELSSSSQAKDTVQKKANTASINAMTSALTMNTSALRANNAAKLSSAGSTVISGSIGSINGFATASSGMSKAASSANVMSKQVSSAITEMLTLSTVSRVAGAAVNFFGGAVRVASGVVAAFGGPLGIALTLLSVLLPIIIYNADATGDLATKQRELNDAMEDGTAKAQQAYDAAQKQEDTCVSLAERYNKLADSVNTAKAAGQDYSKESEMMGEIENTIKGIMGESAVEFDKDGKIKLDSIHKVGDAHKEQSLKFIDEAEEKVKADRAATQAQLDGAQNRIEGMQKESEAVYHLGAAWRALYSIIGEVYQHEADVYQQRLDDYQKHKDEGGLLNNLLAGYENNYNWLWKKVDSSILGVDENNFVSDARANAAKYKKMAGEDDGAAQQEQAALSQLSSEVEALKGRVGEDNDKIAAMEASKFTITHPEITAPEEKDREPKSESGSGGKGGSGSDPQAKLDKEAAKELKDQLKGISDAAKEEKDKRDRLIKAIDEEEKVRGVSMDSKARRDKVLNDYQYAIGELAKQAKEIQGVAGDNLEVSTGTSQIGQSVVDVASSHPEREQWMGNITSDPSIQCDSFTANVYSQAGIPSIGGVDTASSAINDSAFSAANAFHPVGDGYSPKPGDLVSFAGHVGIYMGNDEIISRQSSMGVHRASISEAESYFGAVQGYGSIGEATGLNNEAISNVSVADAVSKLNDEYLKTAKERIDSAIKDVQSMADQADKLAEYNAQLASFNIGLAATSVETDGIKLVELKQKVDDAKMVLDEVKKAYGENSLPYHEANSKYMSAVTEYSKQSKQLSTDRYGEATSNIETSKNLRASLTPEYQGISYKHDELESETKDAEEMVEISKKAYEERYENSKMYSQKDIEEAETQYNNAVKNLEKLNNTYKDALRQSSYELADSILLKGESLKDVWNKLWNQLADTALKALFRINDGTQNLWTSIFGMFSGGGSSGGITSFSGFSSYLPSTAFPHAKGGVIDAPEISLTGEDGEEVVVPTERNTENSTALLAYAAKKLGTSSPVTATVSESTAKKSSELAVSGTQQNSQHLDKLDAQIELMQRQNEMLLHMINNGTGGSNGNIIMQPVVVSQQMDGTQFADMYSRAQRMRTIK